MAPGDLVKLQDDGNLDTMIDSAVYYHGADGKRYVFPNSQTYFTWYADFDRVKIVSPEELASLAIGGNITYRPGTRLAKITTDPNVYAIEPGGTLRWITSEEVARGLYGDLWNKRVDDIPDAFFFNYQVGEPMTAPVYPTGTVVKRSSDGAYFVIENRTKRRIASPEVKVALRVQEAFVITVTSDLSDYPDGADITVAEPALTDTSQKNLTTIPSLPTFSLRLPPTNYIAVGGDVVLLELHMASVKAFTVKKLTAKIDATTDNPASADVDDDKGGLVYQNNAQPNFKQIRFLDGAVEVFGRKEVALDVAQDQSQSFVFSGTYNVPAGQEKVLYLKAQLNSILPNGEGYKVTLPVTGIEVVDSETGAVMAFHPQADIVGPTLTSLNASLEVLASTLPGNKTFVRGSKNAEIAGLSFKATTVAPNVINSVTFQGYIDEEATAGFLPGSDTDNGSPRLVRELVPQLSLYTSAGTKIAGPVSVTTDGRVTFSGLSYLIQAGQTATLVLRGDISATVDLEQQPDRLAFDIVDAEQDMVVVDDKGGQVQTTGTLPNGGTTPGSFATIRKNGTIAFSWLGASGAAIAGREVLLGTFSADAKIDSYALKNVSFKATGSHASIGELRLEYPTAAGGVASVSGSFIGDDATFGNLNIPLPSDIKSDLKLYGKLFSKENGAVYAQQLKVSFASASSLEFVSQSSGEVYDEESWGADFTIAGNTESSNVVRFGLVTLARAADSPGGQIFRENTAEVVKFTVRTEPENGARIRKLTFKVAPGDAGTVGADNDALERWSKVNGDFNDDDAIVDLYQVSSTGAKTLIGEGSSGRIMYSVVHAGEKDVSPADIATAVGDYALIEYVFNEGSELTLGAGITQTFSFGVDTTLFNSALDYGLNVDILTGADFEWTDIMSGTYAALSGTDAVGLPIGTAVTVKK